MTEEEYNTHMEYIEGGLKLIKKDLWSIRKKLILNGFNDEDIKAYKKVKSDYKLIKSSVKLIKKVYALP